MKLLKYGSEEGAVALMTLAFMMVVGAMAIMFVWSLGVITGAYNVLYVANQNAAVAAATATVPADGGSNQMTYYCVRSRPGESACYYFPQQGGSSQMQSNLAAAAAHRVLEDSLEKEPFGLSLGENVFMLPSDSLALQDSGVMLLKAYEVARPAGEIRDAMDRYNRSCSIPAGEQWGTVHGVFQGGEDELHCWRLTEGGVEFPKLYNSGVIVETFADVNLFNCEFEFCQTRIVVKSAATQEQIASPEEVSQYYYYKPRD